MTIDNSNVKRSNNVRFHHSNLTDANLYVEPPKTCWDQSPLWSSFVPADVCCAFWKWRGAEVPPQVGQQRNCHLHTHTNRWKTEKKKKTPANQMTFALYNYKYMYRHWRNLSEFADGLERRWTLGFSWRWNSFNTQSLRSGNLSPSHKQYGWLNASLQDSVALF